MNLHLLSLHKILFEEKKGFVEKIAFGCESVLKLIACTIFILLFAWFFFGITPNTKHTLPNFFQNFCKILEFKIVSHNGSEISQKNLGSLASLNILNFLQNLPIGVLWNWYFFKTRQKKCNNFFVGAHWDEVKLSLICDLQGDCFVVHFKSGWVWFFEVTYFCGYHPEKVFTSL